MEEKQLLGSQIEVLIRAFQNQEMAKDELKRVNEMILDELGIAKKDCQFWQFTNNFKTVRNNKPLEPPKMPINKVPKGDKKDGNKTQG